MLKIFNFSKFVNAKFCKIASTTTKTADVKLQNCNYKKIIRDRICTFVLQKFIKL